MLRWFEEEAACKDVVISSRVRLARNINEYPFAPKLTGEQAMDMISNAGEKIIKLPEICGYRDYILEDLEKIQIEALVERKVISRYLANQKPGMFFVSEDEKNTIMLNEEDHIRIQCIQAGMDLKEAYKRANCLDDAIGQKLEYAYDDNFGYLTTCLSNVGTGMKASCMLHLPALGNSKKIAGLMTEVGSFGINMRGLYGEDGSGCGYIYEISNQKTLGQPEEEFIGDLENICNQIVSQELECRKQIIKKDKIKLEDEIYKSYGILKYSRRLKYNDAMLFLSELRLGMALDIVRFQDERDFIIYQLMVGVQPANLKMIIGCEPSETELCEARATFVRENLPLIN